MRTLALRSVVAPVEALVCYVELLGDETEDLCESLYRIVTPHILVVLRYRHVCELELDKGPSSLGERVRRFLELSRDPQSLCAVYEGMLRACRLMSRLSMPIHQTASRVSSAGL